MKCKFKFKNGKNCRYIAEDGDQFCYVHNQKLLPIFFIGNVDGHERSDFEINLPVEKAQSYINAGLALKIDYAFRKKMNKTIARLLDKLIKDKLSNIKS